MATSKKPTPKKAPAKKPAAKKAPTRLAKIGEPEPHPFGLKGKQVEFVEQYLIDLNATQAAIRAGYSRDSAALIGHENLRKPNIQAAIRARRDELAMAAEVTPETLVRELTRVLLADPRELVEVKVGCCRHCYGEGHKYQRTVAEMNMDREIWAAKGNEITEFDEQGGIGFNPLLPPHPECPDCGGDGLARPVVKDTRNLGPLGQALYAGAKMGKHGIEVQMRDKDAALDRLARILGAYEKDNTQKATPIAELLKSLSGNVIGPVPDPDETPKGENEDDDE